MVVCLLFTVLAGCGDNWIDGLGFDPQDDDHAVPDEDLTGNQLDTRLEDLTISLASSTIDLMQTQPIAVMGEMFSGGRRDVTTTVAWTSSAPAIATVSGATVWPHAVGVTTLTATLGDLTASAQLTVTTNAVSVTSLTVSADNATLPAGESMQYHATAGFSDGTQRDVTAVAAWTVTPSSIASIDSNAVATGENVGAAVVRAQWMGATGSVPLVVTAAQLVRIEIDPASFSLAAGFSRTATATAVYSDGSTLDVTAIAQWSAAPASVATVLPLGIVSAHAVGTATLTAAVGTASATATVTVTSATLTGVEIAPSTINVGVGSDVQLSALGLFSDGTRMDMTSRVTWMIAGIGNAVITQAGKVSSPSAGIATVTALLDGHTATAIVVVTAAQLTQIQVPGAVDLIVGRWFDLSPIGLFSDGLTALLGTGVTFSSSNASVASVSASGRITANGAGDVDITVSSGLITAVIHVHVSAATVSTILVTPVAVVTTQGAVVQMHASATYTDGAVVDVTAQGAWTTGAATIATVSNAVVTRGQLTGVGVGATTVSVTIDGVTAGTLVTVTPAILDSLIVTPPALVLPKGMQGVVVAIGHYSDGSTVDLTTQATWSSSNPAIATVSNSSGTFGHILAKAPGTATITVTKGTQSATVSVTVTAAILDRIELPTTPLVVPRGLTLPVIALGVYSDGSYIDITSSVDWSSSAPQIASVSNLVLSVGVVTGNTVGTATLTASKDGRTAQIPVQVTAALLQSIQLPNAMTVPKGLTLPVVATGTYSDGTTVDITNTVTWSSSATSVASVSNVVGAVGLVTGNAVGDAVLTASYNGKTATIAVHVTAAILDSISFTSSSVAVPRGLTLPLVATGVYSDGSVADLTSSVTWTSSAPQVATVASLVLNAGLVTGVSQGTAVVTATLGTKSATTTVTVTAAILSSIQLPTLPVNVPKGLTVPVIATGVYSDGSIADLTSQVTWSSSSPAIASVSSLAGSIGMVTGNAVGDATLTASLNGKTATVPVHVSSAVLSAIQLPTSTQIVPRGLTLPIIATGVYTDGSLAQLTSSVTWTTSSPSIASVSNLVANAGLVTGIAQGTTTVTATLDGKSASVQVQVTAAILQGLLLQQQVTIAKGLSAPVIATGVYSDGSQADLTASVTWSSSAPTIASVSNLVGSIGIVTGVNAGDALLTATYNGQSSTVPVHVTTALLSGIQLPTLPITVARGLTVPVIATGVYTDGSLADITSSVTWTSSAPTIAAVSNLAGSLGLVTGVNAGTATLTASFGGQSQTLTVNVTAAILSGIQLPTLPVTVPRGLSVPVVATGVYSDGSLVDLTASVAWSSSNQNVASVSNVVGSIGLVTGVNAGTATLTASYGGQSQTMTVTVTAAILSGIQLPSLPVTIAKGLTLPVVATGVYSDGSLADITSSVSWTSSAPMIATVSNLVGSLGLVTGVDAGTATITATFGGQSQTMTVNVTAAILSSIQLPTLPVNVPRGLTVPVIATAVYSDGSLADITSSVTWTSSAPSVASVSNLVGSVGLVTGVTAGDATITATLGGQSQTMTVHVTAAILSAIQLPTGPVLVSRGMISPILATGLYSDGSLAALTQAVTWTSSAPSIATVSNLVGAAGIVTGIQTGSATITAALDGRTATIQVQVTPAILQGITVDAPTLLGLLQVGHATATGHYSDGTSVDLTSQVTFGSSNPLAATVSAGGSLLGLALGSTTITANLGAISGAIQVGIGNDGCHLVINEVKAGALFASKDDFVEIYNPCAFAADVSQLRLVYRATLEITDTVLVTLTGSIPAGGYRVYAGTQYSGGVTPTGTFTTDIGGLLGGGVGLRMIGSDTLVDSVAWGVSINGIGEGALLGAITLGSSLARTPNGKDTNWNLVDFALLTTTTPGAAN